MTEQELQEIKGYASQGTPEPWEMFALGTRTKTALTITYELFWKGHALYDNGFTAEDAYFIVCAHRDIPALVAEVERLRAELEFYAAARNYDPCSDNRSAIALDRGTKARRSLEGGPK